MTAPFSIQHLDSRSRHLIYARTTNPQKSSQNNMLDSASASTTVLLGAAAALLLAAMLYPSSLLKWLQRKRYQYEVTFSLYMLTSTEKFILSKFRMCSLRYLPVVLRRSYVAARKPYGNLLGIHLCLYFPLHITIGCVDTPAEHHITTFLSRANFTLSRLRPLPPPFPLHHSS